jgi:hypothetical protein
VSQDNEGNDEEKVKRRRRLERGTEDGDGQHENKA